MPKYEIRKVVFINHENVESYPLDTDIVFDVYGVYHKEGDLRYWDADFDTLKQAELFVDFAINMEEDNHVKD